VVAETAGIGKLAVARLADELIAGDDLYLSAVGSMAMTQYRRLLLKHGLDGMPGPLAEPEDDASGPGT